MTQEIKYAFPDEGNFGMLLRDYFAIRIMQNLSNDYGHFIEDSRWEHSAKRSYEVADLMMKARGE